MFLGGLINHITWSLGNWSVIWSEEKKFILDGPDGLDYYWADKRCQERNFKMDYSGRGSVMVWGCSSGAAVG